jgi:hypothetical protein
MWKDSGPDLEMTLGNTGAREGWGEGCQLMRRSVTRKNFRHSSLNGFKLIVDRRSGLFAA